MSASSSSHALIAASADEVSSYSRRSAFALLDADHPWLGAISSDPAKGVVVRLTDLSRCYVGVCDAAQVSKQFLEEYGAADVDQMLALLHTCWDGKKEQEFYALRLEPPLDPSLGPSLLWELTHSNTTQLCFKLALMPRSDSAAALRDEILMPLMCAAMRSRDPAAALRHLPPPVPSEDRLPDLSQPRWIHFVRKWIEKTTASASPASAGGPAAGAANSAEATSASASAGDNGGTGAAGAGGGVAPPQPAVSVARSADDERRKRAQEAREKAANKARRV